MISGFNHETYMISEILCAMNILRTRPGITPLCSRQKRPQLNMVMTGATGPGCNSEAHCRKHRLHHWFTIARCTAGTFFLCQPRFGNDNSWMIGTAPALYTSSGTTATESHTMSNKPMCALYFAQNPHAQREWCPEDKDTLKWCNGSLVMQPFVEGVCHLCW